MQPAPPRHRRPHASILLRPIALHPPRPDQTAIAPTVRDQQIAVPLPPRPVKPDPRWALLSTVAGFTALAVALIAAGWLGGATIGFPGLN